MAGRSQNVVRDFAVKLRLTRAALGLSTQKQLAATFGGRKTNTAFSLARSYKWIQGRTLPRSRELLEEWAELVDLGRDADWLAACDLDDFVTALGARYSQHANLIRNELSRQSQEKERSNPGDQGNGYLRGNYACYSYAQSPYYSGRVIRGSLVVSGGQGSELQALYLQQFAQGYARARGRLRIFGPCLLAVLDDVPPELSPMCYTLFKPNTPASLLGGVMQGCVSLHPLVQPPYATRLLAFRVPEHASDALLESNAYLECGLDSVLLDLKSFGFRMQRDSEFVDAVSACLAPDTSGCSTSMSANAYTELSAKTDRMWIDVLERRAADGNA